VTVIFVKPANVGVSSQKPEELAGERIEENFLGGDQRKSFLQGKTHLAAENTGNPDSSSIGLLVALGIELPEEI
jgi:hypothetical protein